VSRLLARETSGGLTRVLAEFPPPRTGRGVGGGCWCWNPDGRSIVYAAADGNLWVQGLRSETPRRLTDHEPRVAQAPTVSPDGALVAYVVDQMEVWAIAIGDARGPTRLDDGCADFCFDPAFSADSRSVTWHAWNVPAMPWDASRLERASIDGRTRGTLVRPAGSVQQPRPTADGRMLAVRDDHGWANVWLDDSPVVAEPFEHASPTWGLGQRSFALSPDGERVAYTRNEAGFGRLCIAEVSTGHVTEVGRGVHGQLSWQGDTICALRSGARTPTQIVLYDVGNAFARSVIDVGPDERWTGFDLPEPEAHTVSADDGGEIHVRLYRAATAGRLICWLHGGPTDQWQVAFLPRLAYWVSRGWSVLVPDHRGSSGHGRAYQQSLRGRWGELDVTDTISVLRAAADRGWGRPESTALFGGSSGGFTVLSVLAADARPDLGCAVVSYPVTDLADLGERSHRFERHYTATLVAPEDFASRSPVTFAHRITTPLLVFHGDADPVVPLAQSKVLVQRMRASGSSVELVVYPGEGHGFRQRDHQLDEYRRIEEFLDLHVLRGRVPPRG
jgi:dipeptidyl aminopeptidase/acylaminoacyl peptidase